MSLEGAPELARRIASGPHEVCSHGWRWVHQHRFDEAEERDFIRRAAESIERTTGARPRGWLSRYLLTDNTRRLLAEEGFAYHMDDYSDDVPFWDEHHRILVVPYALDSNDMKMWTEPAFTPRDWLEYAIDTFEWLWRESREAPAHDVARAAPSDHRAAGAHRVPRALPRSREVPGRGVVRDPGRDRGRVGRGAPAPGGGAGAGAVGIRLVRRGNSARNATVAVIHASRAL